MKKFFFVTSFILLFLFLISNYSAYAGQQCDDLGGICTSTGCNPVTEDSKGKQDCSTGRAGPVCCVPKSVTLTPFISPAPAGSDPQFPLVNCGNAEAKDPESRKCCQPPTEYAPGGIIDWLKKIPLIGDIAFNSFINVTDRVLQLKRITDVPACVIGFPSTDKSNPSCECQINPNLTPTPVQSIKDLCSDYFTAGSKEKEECDKCADNAGVWTALGVCAYGDLGRFITETVFGWGVGFAGLIALLCIIYSAFIMQTSGGNPERIKKAQENLTSCIMGLMLIIFAVFILQIIGVQILKIPGFR